MAEDWIDGDDDGDPFHPDHEERQRKRRAAAVSASSDDARAVLEIRQRAYRAVFGKAEPEALEIVMADLRRFCRGGETTWSRDAREHALLTGRQEVYMRIDDNLNLQLDALVERYT